MSLQIHAHQPWEQCPFAHRICTIGRILGCSICGGSLEMHSVVGWPCLRSPCGSVWLHCQGWSPSGVICKPLSWGLGALASRNAMLKCLLPSLGQNHTHENLECIHQIMEGWAGLCGCIPMLTIAFSILGHVTPSTDPLDHVQFVLRGMTRACS